MSLDPEAKNNALLLSTNTEVSISPKLHSKARTAVVSERGSVSPDHAKPRSTPRLSSQILRVLPAHILSEPPVSHSGPEVVGYVSFSALARIHSQTTTKNTYHKVSVKRLEPPTNPEGSALQATDPVAETKVLIPSEKGQQTAQKDSDKPNAVYICGRHELIEEHVVFPVLPSGVEHWDLIRYA